MNTARALGNLPMQNVDPDEPVVARNGDRCLRENPRGISLHLEDGMALDRGSLQEVPVGTGENR